MGEHHSRESGAAPDLVPLRRALLSASDRTGLVEFAQALAGHGVELVSTGGTARALAEAGLAVTAVEALTGVPEMMDGRVKTLHPRVHGGLLARRDDPSHRAAMEAHGIPAIDLVCINLYPFEETASRPDAGHGQVVEQIDIGGPAMIRSAAKNHDFVAVATDPAQYRRIVEELAAHDGATTLALRRELAAAAFARTAAYDAAIAAWMGGHADPFPARLATGHRLMARLRYGENPHQRAAVYAAPGGRPTSVAAAAPLGGREPSYNNLLDAAAALELVQDLHAALPHRAAAAIVKHTNPCGAAVAESLRAAFLDAYAGDPLAAYGGILALSRPVDLSTAEAIVEGERFLEVIVAPRFEPGVADRLSGRWRNVRLVEVGELAPPHAEAMLRSIPGGLLVQDRDAALPDPASWRVAIGPPLDPAQRESAVVAALVAKHLKSNAVCIVRGTALVGAGAGQMDRVASCRLAVEKARAALAAPGPTPVAASDAFFPFADGPAVLLDAGVRVLLHPGGSRRDEETLDLCRERGATCVLTGVRAFRH